MVRRGQRRREGGEGGGDGGEGGGGGGESNDVSPSTQEVAQPRQLYLGEVVRIDVARAFRDRV